jgi:plastocyanin
MKTWVGALTVCCAVALPLAGCGGGDDDNGGGGGTKSTTTQQSTAPTSTGGGASVTMKDIQFNPAKVKIKTGQTVTWTNDDSVGHDVTADSFKSGSAGGIEGGQTFQHTFKAAGTFSYVCTVHPGMKGTVVVTK